ncbi:MAG: hypothetical protein LRY68_05520 [Sulfurospirillum sp.]|nr:hypothetical protein [Sulfurospirillum sp.]
MKFWLTLFVSCSSSFFKDVLPNKKGNNEVKNMSSSETLKREKITLNDVDGKAIIVTSTEKGFTIFWF